MKDNTFDLQKECGYVPWTEELKQRVDRWIKAVLNMQDPSIGTVNEVEAAAKEVLNEAPGEGPSQLDDPNDPFNQAMSEGNDDLPF